MKRCGRCKKTKDDSEFHKHKNGKNGLSTQCKECRNEYNRNNPKLAKNRILRFKYGITLEEYNRMFADQKGKCAICGKHQSELEKSLAVDHNHETGEIRGLLCTHCNVFLGHINDDYMFLNTAIKYLNRDKQ